MKVYVHRANFSLLLLIPAAAAKSGMALYDTGDDASEEAALIPKKVTPKREKSFFVAHL